MTKDDDLSNDREADHSAASLMTLAPQISALAVTYSLVLGAASLVGKVMGLGVSGTEFITVTDIGTQAVKVSPFVVGILAIFLLYRFVEGWGSGEDAIVPGYRASRIGLKLAIVAFFVAFLTVPPSLGIDTVQASIFLGCVFLFNISVDHVRKKIAPRWVLVMAFVVLTFTVHFALTYGNTARKVLRLGSTPGEHEVCTTNGECFSGDLIARFSAVTAFAITDDHGVTYFANDDVAKVVVVTPREDRAVFPIWSWLASAYRWVALQLTAAPGAVNEDPVDAEPRFDPMLRVPAPS
ncbi:MAG: hypothetical protein JJ911_12670 [Rhizobiaceae bacterium]|nr:hypothetical protein [Rhizobiaceae bacterium]